MSARSLAAILFVAGLIALVDQLRTGRFSRRSYLMGALLAVLGAVIGWTLGAQLDLPELVGGRIDGRAAPLMWTSLGAATFVLALDIVRARRRPVRAVPPRVD